MSNDTVGPRPRLKGNETPSSPSYQKRLGEWQRKRDLAEATRMQKEQRDRESKKNAKRDVLKEVSKGVAEADAASRPPAKAKKKSTSGSDTSKRRRALDKAIEDAGA